MDNFELLYSLFNQYLFSEAKRNISNIKYYFDTNPSTMGNPLIDNMLGAIRDYDLEAIGQPLFQSILMKCNKTSQESSNIMSSIIRWKGYTKEQMSPAREYLEQVCARAELEKIGRLYSASPKDYIKQIKNLNLQFEDLDVFNSVGFGDVDINSLVAESEAGFIPSRYKWINDTFQPYPGYERGQMVIICAAPATGKSLFCMSEALHMASSGYKVLYVGLGDNKMKDFIVRLGAMYSGLSFGDTMKRINEVYNSLKEVLKDNLEISINPAGKISAEEIVEYVKSRPEFDVVVVDYDSNLKGVGEGEVNMYNSFGSAYETLTQLTLMNKLVFIGSQTKVTSWDSEVIRMSDVGESSRKQHSADMIIGIGRVTGCPNHVHCLNISKSRRGEVDVKSYCIRLGNGRFYPISRGLYEALKEESEKKQYTEVEIEIMDRQYRNQEAMISNKLAMAGQQYQQSQQQVLDEQAKKFTPQYNPFLNN